MSQYGLMDHLATEIQWERDALAAWLESPPTTSAPLASPALPADTSRSMPLLTNPFGRQGKGDSLPVMRVNQTDAASLDHELTNMFSQEISHIFKYLNPQSLVTYKPELSALLRLLIWRFTIYIDEPSPGNSLQNLRYHNEYRVLTAGRSRLFQSQKLWYAGLFIGLPYVWSKAKQFMQNEGWQTQTEQHTWRGKLYKTYNRLENLYRVCNMLNFLSFLANGSYLTLVERLLRIRLVYLRPKMNRQLDFDFMNQQLMWHGLSEFLIFLAPIINFRKIRLGWHRFLRTYTPYGSGKPAGVAADGTLLNVQEGEVTADQLTGCPVCLTETIVTPHQANCGHIFCYYCLRASRIEQPGTFVCPICEELIVSQTRARVVTSSPSPSPSSSSRH